MDRTHSMGVCIAARSDPRADRSHTGEPTADEGYQLLKDTEPTLGLHEAKLLIDALRC